MAAIDVPDEVLAKTGVSSSEVLREAAVALFEQDRLTLGQAAALAGMSLWEFQRLLGARRIEPHYGVAEFEADVATLGRS